MHGRRAWTAPHSDTIFTYLLTHSPAGERLVARVRQQLFEALVMQDIAFYDSAKTGELMNRLSADTTGGWVRRRVPEKGEWMWAVDVV